MIEIIMKKVANENLIPTYEVVTSKTSFGIILKDGQELGYAPFFRAWRKECPTDDDVHEIHKIMLLQKLFDQNDEQWILKNENGDTLAQKF